MVHWHSGVHLALTLALALGRVGLGGNLDGGKRKRKSKHSVARSVVESLTKTWRFILTASTGNVMISVGCIMAAVGLIAMAVAAWCVVRRYKVGAQRTIRKRASTWGKVWTAITGPNDFRFFIELVFFVWGIFYLDLILDLQALVTFWTTGNPKFFFTNLAAMVFAAIYTGWHIYSNADRLLADLTRTQIFTLGLLFPFQQHVTYLCWISWCKKKKHQLLIDAKFAEAAIEAVVSCQVQTYAVVFAAGDLTSYQMMTLYLSILGSLISISNAFTMFDAPNGIDEAPGNEKTTLSPKLLTVNAFRLCELTNKITAFALFQLATRPLGVYIAAMADLTVIALLIWLAKGQLFFAPPCVFSMMNPMLETHNAVTMPHAWYYALRMCEMATMGAIVYKRTGGDMGLYEDTTIVVMAFGLSLAGMLLLLPVVRCFAKSGLVAQDPAIYDLKEWARKPFSLAQIKLRQATMMHDPDGTCLQIMLKPVSRALQVVRGLNRVEVDGFLEEVGEEPTVQPLHPPPVKFMQAVLHIMNNCPVEEDPKTCHELLTWTLRILNEQPLLMGNLFVRTNGIQAVAALVLHDCAISEDALARRLPPDISELFLCAACALVLHLDVEALQGLEQSPLPAALAAAVLEQTLVPRDSMRQVMLALCGLFCGKTQREFTSDGVVALLSGVSSMNTSKELLVAVPDLLVQLTDDLALYAQLSNAAALCVPLCASMLRQLDGALESQCPKLQHSQRTVLLSPESSRVLEGAQPDDVRASLHKHLTKGISSVLKLLSLLIQSLSEKESVGLARTVQQLVVEQQQSALDPQAEREKAAKDWLLTLGAKGHLPSLHAALSSGASADDKLPGSAAPLLVHAVEKGSNASVCELLSFGAARLSVDGYGRTALHAALDANIATLLPALLPRNDFKLVDTNGMQCPGMADCRYTQVATCETQRIGSAAIMLEERQCPAGHEMNERSPISAYPPVRLGRWRRHSGSTFNLRLQHGYLVASSLSGAELWRTDAALQLEEEQFVSWANHGRQQLQQEGKTEPKDVGIQQDSEEIPWPKSGQGKISSMALDHLVLDNEHLHFMHWDMAGYEGKLIFRGAVVQFDGRGDATRVGGHDYQAVYSSAPLIAGTHYYEFTFLKVVCNTYVGITAAADSAETRERYRRGGGRPPPNTWAYVAKPQHRKHVLTTPAGDVEAPDVSPNAVLAMLVDMDRKTVQFWYNSDPLGEEITGLPTKVWLYGCQDSEGDRFALAQKPIPDRIMLRGTNAEQTSETPTVWQCSSCLCMHHSQHQNAVRCWACDTCKLVICEACMLGVGALPDGQSGLHLATWSCLGDLDEEGDTDGFIWAMELKSCFSKKQVLESLVLAALGDHSERVQRLLDVLGAQPMLPAAECKVGRFGGGLLEPSMWPATSAAQLALHAALFAARPRATAVLLKFLGTDPGDPSKICAGEATAKQEPIADEGRSITPSENDIAEASYPDIELAKLPEPWFQFCSLPLLLAALNSYCATARQLQRHEHALFSPASEIMRPCSTCGATRASQHCGTCSFAQCAQCISLVGRPLSQQQEACEEVVTALLLARPKCVEKTLPRALQLPIQCGDFMLLETEGTLMQASVNVVEALSPDGSGDPQLKVVAGGAMEDAATEAGDEAGDAEDEEDDGDATKGPSKARLVEDPSIFTLDYSEGWEEQCDNQIREATNNCGKRFPYDVENIIVLNKDDDEIDEAPTESDFPLKVKIKFGEPGFREGGTAKANRPRPAVDFAEGCNAFHLAATLPSERVLVKLMTVLGVIKGKDRESSEAQEKPSLEMGNSVASADEPAPLWQQPAEDGCTPLHLAAAANRPRQLQRLLAARADASAQNNRGQSPLMVALQLRHTDVALQLIHAVPQPSDTNASQSSNSGIDCADEDGCTALHYAVNVGTSASQEVENLLQQGASPSIATKTGETSLMLAVQRRSPELCRLLLAKDMPWYLTVVRSVDAVNNQGDTALLMAVTSNCFDVIELILQAGANSSKENTKTQNAPIELARSTKVVAALCTRSSTSGFRPQILQATHGTALSLILGKANGQKKAEELLRCIGLETLVEAASNNAREIEFLMHHSVRSTEDSTEEARRKLLLRVVALCESPQDKQSLLSQVLVRSVLREDAFSATLKFIIEEGADLSKALPLAIKKGRVTAVRDMLAPREKASKTRQQIIRDDPNVAKAAQGCTNQEVLELLAGILFGDAWKAKQKAVLYGQGEGGGEERIIQRLHYAVSEGMQLQSDV